MKNECTTTPVVKLVPGPYVPSKEVEEIAKKLLNPLTLQAKIAYLMSERESSWLGRCQLLPAPVKLLTGYDYIIYVNANAWDNLSPTQKEALVFHELEHIGYKPSAKDETIGKWTTRGHDLEEFNSVAKKYGKWLDDVEAFDNSLKAFKQRKESQSMSKLKVV